MGYGKSMRKFKAFLALLFIITMFLLVLAPSFLLGYWLGGPIGGLCLVIGELVLYFFCVGRSQSDERIQDPKPV